MPAVSLASVIDKDFSRLQSCIEKANSILPQDRKQIAHSQCPVAPSLATAGFSPLSWGWLFATDGAAAVAGLGRR
jgi:hypothetical protein